MADTGLTETQSQLAPSSGSLRPETQSQLAPSGGQAPDGSDGERCQSVGFKA